MFTSIIIIYQLIKNKHFQINSKIIQISKYNLKNYYNNFFEELRGLSKATNIPIDTFIEIQIFLSKYFSEQCTTSASTYPATKNNQTFLTMNMDSDINSPMLYIIRLLFTKKYHVSNNLIGYRYIFLGLPIIYEIPLINEKGLGFGGNGIVLTEDNGRKIDEGEGIPTYLLERNTMRSCSNVTEVAKLWKASKRSSHKEKNWPFHWDYSSSVWCDREGGILVIEQTSNYIITVFGNSTNVTNSLKGILWHSNHHQWLDPNLTGSTFPYEYPPSGMREDRMRELLEINYGNIDLNICKKITRDHAGGTNKNGADSSDICRHADKNNSHLTAFAWIIEPKKFTVHWTFGQPCKSSFIKYNFSNIFDKSPPFTNIEIQGELGNSNWYKSVVKIYLNSIDNITGIDNIYYRINNGFWKIYKDPIKFNFNGNYLIEYFAKDNSGNIESIKKKYIKIDRIQPNVIIFKYKIGLFSTAFWSLAVDKNSKIDRVEFYVDGTIKKKDSQRPFNWVFFGTGFHQIRIIGYDNAGNSMQKTKYIFI